jgi:hypothetical protein
MLLVAIHRDDPIILAALGEAEGVDQTLAITAVGRMTDAENVGSVGQELGGAVGAAVIDDEDVALMELPDLLQDRDDIFSLVIDWDGNQDPHAHSLLTPGVGPKWAEALWPGGASPAP